jgi:hypothetical protein
MWRGRDPFDQNWLESVLATLEDFDSATSPAIGAVLFPRNWAGTELPANITAAMTATQLRLSSLDYAKRRYVDVRDDPDEARPLDRYTGVYKFCTRYMDDAAGRLETSETEALTYGVYAAAVALERLRSTFSALSLLYRLGLNYEGDAVARQALEQIAWALVAAGTDDEAAVRKLRANKCVTQLRSFESVAGVLYGFLSESTHAGLAHHQVAHTVSPDTGTGIVRLAWPRLHMASVVTVRLADLWVLVWEHSQRLHLTEFVAVNPDDEYASNPSRSFLVEAMSMAADVKDDPAPQEGAE